MLTPLFNPIIDVKITLKSFKQKSDPEKQNFKILIANLINLIYKHKCTDTLLIILVGKKHSLQI